MVGCFPLNEAGGIAVNIITGARYAPINGAKIISTQFGCMLDCNGAKGVVGDAESDLIIQTPLSIFWAGVHLGNPSSNSNYAGVTYTNGDVNPYSGYGVATNGAGSIVAQFNDSSYHDIVDNQPSVIGLNQRNAIGLTYVPGTQALYVNSRAQGASFTGTSISYSGPKFAIGYDPNNGARDSKSYADVVYVWRRIITRQEFLQLWAQPYSVFEPPGLRLYSFANPAVSATATPSGIAASPGISAPSVIIGISIAGIGASAGIGTVTAGLSANVALSGVHASAAVGSLANGDAAIAGIRAAALAQAPTVDFSSIRGVQASPGLGTLTAGGGTSAAPIVGGLALAPGIGTLTVNFDSIRGVAAAPGVGTLAFKGDAVASPEGIAAFSAAGQPVGQVTVSYATVQGVAASPGVGTMTVRAGATVTPLGIAAATGIGSLLGINTRFALFIDGIDRTRMLMANTMQGSRDMTGQTSASFTLFDRLGRYVPQYRDEVAYYLDGVRIFGGLVQKTEVIPYECRRETKITVSCTGYQQIALDRTYTGTFVGPIIDLKTTVKAIVAGGLTGEILSYSDDETSTINALRFPLPGDTVHACLQKVASTWGYNYWIDNDARIRMERVRWQLAPYVIRDQATQGRTWRNMRVRRDASQYRNTQGIRGRIPLTQPTTGNTGEVRMSADEAEIARRGAVVEAVTTVRNVLDKATADAMAEAMTAKHGAPVTEIEFESDLPYWEIGQAVHVFTTSPAAAGLFQIRALSFREVDLTFVRYTLTLQAPELPAITGVDVTDNGDGSNTLTFGIDRGIDFNGGEPFTFTGTGESNVPEFGNFGEKGINITALTATFVTDHWELLVTVESWLGTLPGEAIRMQGVVITATGGHGLSYGDPVGSINSTWTVHAINRDARTMTIRTGLDGNKVVDFSGLVYTNPPDGLAFGAQKLGGLDGNWIVNGSNGTDLTVITSQTLHIQSITVTAGVDENTWTVRLNLDHVPKHIYATGATAPMIVGDGFSINGMESTTPLSAAAEPVAARAAIIRDVIENGLNGRWVCSGVGIDPEKWIEFHTNQGGNKKLILTGFAYANSPDATAYVYDASVSNPPIDVPAGPIDIPGGNGFSGIPTVPGDGGNTSGIGATSPIFRVVNVNNQTGEVTVDRDHSFTTSYPDTLTGSVVCIMGVTAPEGINNPVCRITVTGARAFIAQDSFDAQLAFEPAFKNDGQGIVVLTDSRVRYNLASSPTDPLSHALGLTAGSIPLDTDRITFFLPNGVPGIPSRGLVVGDNVTDGFVAQKDISVIESVYVSLGVPGMGDVGVDGSGDVVLDVTKNGTSIFAAGGVTIPGGSTDPITVTGLAENPAYVMQGDTLNVDVKKTGSQFPGCSAKVIVNTKG